MSVWGRRWRSVWPCECGVCVCVSVWVVVFALRVAGLPVRGGGGSAGVWEGGRGVDVGFFVGHV